MKVKIVIPARLNSVRFPRKILADIKGKPLLWWTWRRAQKVSGKCEVIIAVDDARVKKIMEGFGAKVLMTSAGCRNGTERVAQAVLRDDADVLVNVQADEPLFPVSAVRKLIDIFRKRKEVYFGTLAFPLKSAEDIRDPNIVKVVTNSSGYAVYFSRSVIPFCRETKAFPGYVRAGRFLKHIGIYAYRRDFLLRNARIKGSYIDELEKLEQLKYLYHGKKILVVKSGADSTGVDTPADLDRVKKKM